MWRDPLRDRGHADVERRLPLSKLPKSGVGPGPAFPDDRGIELLRLAGRTLLLPLVARGHTRVLRRCGSPLTYRDKAAPDEIDVMTCSLDDPDVFPPQFRVWIGHRPSWLDDVADLPAFARTREG